MAPKRGRLRTAPVGLRGSRRSVQPAEAGDTQPAGDRQLVRWLLPAALALAFVSAAAGALILDRDDRAMAGDASGLVTPVLSARRVPEVIAAPVADRRLAGDLSAWVAQLPRDTCLVVETSGEQTLFAHNPTTPLAGASSQKLLTAAALLLAKGPDSRLETTVGAAGPVEGGVVAGDLFVVGGGDSLLATPEYAASRNRNRGAHLWVDPAGLADAIVAAGVTRIDGSVVGDGSRYDAERYHPVWPGRFLAQNVVGPIGALTVDDGFTQPGRTPTGDPAMNAAAVLTDLLRQRGVTVAGEARSGSAPAALSPVAALPSHTIRELVAEMLTDSDNETAEMALKEIGVDEGGSGTWSVGAQTAATLMAEAGLPLDGIEVVDGSGLSDANQVTCQLLVDLLTWPEIGPMLVDGLAVAGQTGTLAGRWNDTPVEGRLQAKTGTLRNVTALSGRVSPLQGGTLTFAYVTNVPAPQVLGDAELALQNGLADILISYPRGVDVTALEPVASDG
jgi:D-alanyl-D-alanine carboxypeptidase/D-alanyl-D-alanine-endopeptidase (penicillin-binding protein 4)